MMSVDKYVVIDHRLLIIVSNQPQTILLVVTMCTLSCDENWALLA